MSSIIPKIKIGLAQNRKEKHNLSFDCSTTANLGTIQPTMCREMIPNEKFKVKVSSLVRLASMPLPTFGRMSLRHYHCFVPYADLYQPFDALMSGQHFQGSAVTSFIPTSVPYFNMTMLIQTILNWSDISIAPSGAVNHPLTITTTNVDYYGNVYVVGDGEGEYSDMAAAIKAAQAADLATIQTAWSALRLGNNNIFGGSSYTGLYTHVGSLKSDDYGVLRFGEFYGAVTYQDDTLAIAYDNAQGQPNISHIPGMTAISPSGADLITRIGSYTLLLKFKEPLKRLRQIFIGLGYQFSPYNTESLSVLKLLAYYKAWFTLFRPNREIAFVDTNCYKLIKKLSDANGASVSTAVTYWSNFIQDLMTDCYYYLPMDYFSMAVRRPQDSNQDVSFVMDTRAGSSVAADGSMTNVSDLVAVGAQGSPYQNVANLAVQGSTYPNSSNPNIVSPLTLKLAQRMLTWANKNTVLGRSIRQYLKVHFGVTDVNSIDSEAVYRIGASRTNIQISDVMSTAENSEGYLGEYGGKGIGYNESETFDFTTDKFGVWLTLTVVVPESGYYQGYMKENRHLNRYQFFNPEFDALGYQVLERGEIKDDFDCDNGPGTGAGSWNPKQSFGRSYAFGFVPRYSEYKVGRNIVNGDLSLVGMFPSMGGYTLDRRFPSGKYVTTEYSINGMYADNQIIQKPDFVPTVVADNFRRIDPTDHLGQYNRIFNVTSNEFDHFIIHNLFDVVAYAPMKSLSNSFDTVSSDDDGSIDVSHS